MKTELVIRVPEDTGLLYERILYPAGEVQMRLKSETVKKLFEADTVTVVSKAAHLSLMELALLSDAIFHIRPYVDSTLVLPYLPYSRADRRFTEGDCHGLQVFGEMLQRMRYHRVVTLDVHSFRARGHLTHMVNVLPRYFIGKAIADICDKGGHPVVLLPDEGAQRYNLDGALQASKKRDPSTGELSGFTVPELPDGKDVLIVDDICDGGGTFIGLAEAINTRWGSTAFGPVKYTVPKPKKLYLYVTHGIFSKGLLTLAKYFEKIYTTNSICTWSEHWIPDGWNSGAQTARNKVQIFDCIPELLEVAK